ncbi:MAG: M13 family peptidase [Actinobacteria bacterium]|nr:MAG: M13 family peptidase [Actinomycetota bacterium]
MTPHTALISGVDSSGADPSVRAQDDFYRAWHGRWLEEFQIPADKAEYAAFTTLHDTAQEQLRDIITELAESQPDPGSVAGKLAALYASYLDTERRDELGVRPLAEELAQIDALTSVDQLGAIFGAWDRAGLGGPLGTYVHQDNMDSSRYLLDVWQSGIGLPDRDYYLDDKFADVLADYRTHVAHMWQLAGFGDAEAAADAADRIVALETALAEAQWDKVRNRDPQATYNLVSPAEFDDLTGGLDSDAFLAGVGVSVELEDLNLAQPGYLTELGRLIGTTPLADWQDYLRWRLLARTSSLLSTELDDANFAFYGTRLSGTPEQRPLWKRGVALVQGAMPEALGQIYVERHFPPANKQRMVELVDNLLRAFGAAIDELDWMSADTKAEARAKLATFRAKIGYPDVWRDYSALTADPTDLVGNVRRSSVFEHDYEIGKLGGPVDRDEWLMPPQMVNAYYNPEMNEIVFPAAILQPPFFTMAADDAVNYGGIGAVIGHEISHGFDDKGSQYDGEGNLRNWWTEADHAAFSERTAALEAQYAGYEPVAGHPINGELTLGENIADLSGLAVALRAYRASLAGAEAPVIDGLTGEQRFFAGWAQVWRAKTRTEEAIRRVATDPHSPPEYRVLGVLVNSDDFVAAFDVQPGDGMWRDPSARVRIW